MILYFCPDVQYKSAGVRILYRHVQVLAAAGIPAAILHDKSGFRITDAADVPIRYFQAPGAVSASDIIVIPEGLSDLTASLANHPVRRIVIALNWDYIYAGLPDDRDWRDFKVERVLTHSPVIADFVQWSMGLPTHVFNWGIRPDLYFFDPAAKLPQISFIRRKQEAKIRLLWRMLRSRDRRFVEQIQWKGLHDLSESDYAAEVRRSTVFLNLSEAEGLPCSLLEAMRAGAFVAGYPSVGGQPHLIGTGEQRNCILADNLDYADLAKQLEPLLVDLLRNDLTNWELVRQNALTTSNDFTPEAECDSILKFWRELPDENAVAGSRVR